jgi:hypothetical protein
MRRSQLGSGKAFGALMYVERFNPNDELCQRYEDLVEMLSFRYGPTSQGVAFILYEELIALRRLQVEHPDLAVLRAWISDISRRLGQRYQDELPAPCMDHPTAVVGTGPVVIEYSRAAFEKKYHSVADTVQHETIALTNPILPAPIRDGLPYMYVIDDIGRFLVWRRPFSFEEIVFGRTKATVNGVPVGHPMLVPQRLRASAAGEVVFIGSPRVRAVIINNKSGHFRFPPSSREVIQDSCRCLFRLADDAIDIFVVGGFEVGLVRNLSPKQQSVSAVTAGVAI